ncbi:Asp23/Gls24 family envelope stress response protein [Chloroflexia bacterium SDU3-3]|nr:Asp23/Gls24 family envelope stress response protein [Chloroflexia bacterium SDU3-3]
MTPTVSHELHSRNHDIDQGPNADAVAVASPLANHGPVAMTDTGATAIATNVVAKIAGIAAREVEGVHALVGSGAGDALSGLAQRVTGEDASERGVSVEVGQREAAVDLKLITVYGASIPDVAQAVRKNIIGRMQEMTGLIVTEVNIDVVDLYFPEDTSPTPEVARTAPRVA